MDQYFDMGAYWNGRFKDENMIWGEQASKTAEYALKLFSERIVKNILVPGAGYGRNTKLFSNNGYTVVGVEISDQALKLAKEYDKKTFFIHSSVLDARLENGSFDAIYCFNVLHLFRENERRQFMDKCHEWLQDGGYIFFTVFSTDEKSYRKGAEVEKNTFESKPGRPVHYFSDEDIIEHFHRFNIIETGLMEDHENHGEEGPHVHTLRYIFAQKSYL